MNGQSMGCPLVAIHTLCLKTFFSQPKTLRRAIQWYAVNNRHSTYFVLGRGLVFRVAGGLIHLLLVVALILFVLHFLNGRGM